MDTVCMRDRSKNSPSMHLVHFYRELIQIFMHVECKFMQMTRCKYAKFAEEESEQITVFRTLNLLGLKSRFIFTLSCLQQRFTDVYCRVFMFCDVEP